ncbi:uncharacterized protein CDAR_461281 [Caerostris darwini]|uniref:Tetraspanin n=1 Tax=Caerostris darwini TaxID=1538125 RepID=A0AAV4SCG3_9ARAC|nr:uncharacterized protein CDAR_461281 [Caerostris darwini]
MPLFNAMCFSADTDILVLHSDEAQHVSLTRTLRFINALLWLSGAAVVGTGAFVNADTRHPNRLLDVVVFRTVNVMLIVSGAVVLAFSVSTCFEYFFKKRITLCVFTYLGTVVFVLQCIIAALSFTWKTEIGQFVEKELSSFVLEKYHQVDRGPEKLLAFDYIQSTYQCCGAHNYTDWQSSGWIRNRSRSSELPVSCCQKVAIMADCSSDNPDVIYKERYEYNVILFRCFPGVHRIREGEVRDALPHHGGGGRPGGLLPVRVLPPHQLPDVQAGMNSLSGMESNIKTPQACP